MSAFIDGSNGITFPDGTVLPTSPIGTKNRLINGNFSVNQRAVSGTVTLAAGVYGHDRWKAGASGCTYTFAASGIDTIITVTAGSLTQVVENIFVEGGIYTLSNAGTAQARIAVNGATPAGAYAAVPLVSAAATANQQVTVEFTTGTVSLAQLEQAAGQSRFERLFPGMILQQCQRYTRSTPSFLVGQAYSTSAAFYALELGTAMRTTPSLTAGTYQTSNSAGAGVNTTPTITSLVGNTLRIDVTGTLGSPLGIGNATVLSSPSGSLLISEL